MYGHIVEETGITVEELTARARRILQHEQRRNYANDAVRNGLHAFFTYWAAEARDQEHLLVDRLETMFANYATLDPMQRQAQVRAALALLDTISPTTPPTTESVPQNKNNHAIPTPPRATAPVTTPTAPTFGKPATPPTPPPKKSVTAARGKQIPSELDRPGEPVGEYLLDQPVTTVQGVGPAIAEKFRRLGIKTLRDLLYYLPREHLNYADLTPIGALPFDEIVTTRGVIWEVETPRAPKSRTTRTIARISDESGEIRAVWFNQPFLQKQLPRGNEIVLTGIKQRFGNAVQFTVRSYELVEQGDMLNTGRLVPVYSLTEGLSAKVLRRATKWAVDRCARLVADYMPPIVIRSAGILPLAQALTAFHYPPDEEALEAARLRLAFDEMFFIQLGMLARRANWHIGPPAPHLEISPARIFASEKAALPAGALAPLQPQAAPIQINGLWGDLITTADCFEEALPYRFTAAQQRVIREILRDLESDRPMCRLVQGDVGSGKTAVAAAALNGYQGAIMAPTEILAEQHARALTKMLAPFGIEVVLLVGSLRARQRSEVLAAIETNRAQIVVGTHALIQEGVTFARLGLAVVDEQHRFGVEQREELRRKGGDGRTPHLLVMTATPIPRTLALAVYGDLDLSVIDEMPRGRLPIITRWRAGSRRSEAEQQMAWEVAQGYQGYIICPLIEESEALEAKAAVAEYERLRTEVYPELRLGLVHGGMKPTEKDAVMRQFRDGEIDILVATAVVEVGVDVPNATMMIIEDADRFGLAQLHQFRGRVGRGAQQSYCYLLSQEASANARARLTVVESTTDGFKLAEADLRLRGPGEFFGTRQSGLPELRVAELTDSQLVSLAREEAERLWQTDPFLQQSEHSALRIRIATFWGDFVAQ
jgi:ATP-dependent DNA helicase RecG